MRQSFVMIPGRSFVFQAPLALLLAVSAVEFAVQVAWSSPVSVRGITIDRFGAAMGMLVSLIGLTCIRYADRQLEGHPKKGRFLRLMAGAACSAYLMASATYLPLLFAAWFCSSLCLHGLLTFCRDRPEAFPPARKKFLISRLGDIFLLAAIWLVWRGYDTLDLRQFLDIAASVPPTTDIALIAGLVVAAALTKSAQFPFHTWLPETMEAPTPVSALMHAGIINAGGVILWRFAPVLVQAPAAMLALSAIGTLTFVIASLAMWVQPKVKRQLAWSTVGQMGFMMVQCGLGAFHAAALHMVGHGCYKAFKFLSAGDVPAKTEVKEAAPAAVLCFWLLGTAFAFPTLAFALWLADCAPWESAGEMALCWVAALSAGQFWAAGALNAPMSRIARVALCLGGTVVVTLLAAAMCAMARFLWSPLPLGVQPIDAGMASLTAAIPVTALMVLSIVHALAPVLAGTRSGKAMRVHALNGFYLGIIADQWVSKVWGRSVVERGNIHA